MRFLGTVLNIILLGMITSLVAIASLFWYYGSSLPSTEQLKNYAPATLSRIYGQDGGIIGEFAKERRIFTPIDEIPPMIKNAFLSSEDKNFYQHTGVDGIGIAKAMLSNIQKAGGGSRLRGASTITQQVTKNFLLSNERSIERKIKEVLLAMRLEKTLTKDQILELYLNEIFLGGRSYGVTAAALAYFQKPLDQLSIEEAAYLAALPKAPSNYHPMRHYSAAIGRRNYVINEMQQNGYITKEQAETAKAKTLVTRFNQDQSLSAYEDPGFGFFAEDVRRKMIEQFGEEKTYYEGYTIRTSYDPVLQKIAEKSLRQALEKFDRTRGFAGPVAKIDQGLLKDPQLWRQRLAEQPLPRDVSPMRLAVVLGITGENMRLGIDGDPSDSAFIPFNDFKDWARPRLPNDELGPKPKTAGDVLKIGDVIYVAPFVPASSEDPQKPPIKADSNQWSLRQLPEVQGSVVVMEPHTGRILAMQGGYSYQQGSFNRASQAMRQPGSAFKPVVYAAGLDFGYTPATIVVDGPVSIDQGPGLPPWQPKNYSEKFYGPSPMRLGLEFSRNLMTVRIAQDVGMEKVAEYAKKFGIFDQMPPFLSYSLGAGETTLLKMVASYAIFANGGHKVVPSLIDRVQDRRGTTIFRADQRICAECAAPSWDKQPEPFVPDEREEVLDPITSYQITSMLEGVTLRGTADKLRLLGFPVAGKTGTTNDAKDAWFIGYSPNLVVGCYIGYDNPRSLGDRATGGALCAPVFDNFMREAMQNRPKLDFHRPAGIDVVKVNRYTGQRVSDESMGKDIIWEVFRQGTAPEYGQTLYGHDAFTGTDAPILAPGETAPAPANIGVGSGGLY